VIAGDDATRGEAGLLGDATGGSGVPLLGSGQPKKP